MAFRAKSSASAGAASSCPEGKSLLEPGNPPPPHRTGAPNASTSMRLASIVRCIIAHPRFAPRLEPKLAENLVPSLFMVFRVACREAELRQSCWRSASAKPPCQAARPARAHDLKWGRRAFDATQVVLPAASHELVDLENKLRTS